MLEITEISISWILSSCPSAPVNNRVILMVDSRNDDCQRAISLKKDELPDWILKPKTKDLKFVYDSPLQKIECVYHSTKKTFTCLKIKYININKIDKYISDIFFIIKVKPIKVILTKYKATTVINLKMPWNKEIFADIVTNDSRVSQIMALSEQISTIKNKRFFSMVVNSEFENIVNMVRVTITTNVKTNKQILVTISKAQHMTILKTTVTILTNVFEIYYNKYTELTNIYAEKHLEIPVIKKRTISGIKMLRKELPSLFINNYTRECPVLPIIIPSYILHQLPAHLVTNVIYYPKNSIYGRYYTAPDGYFVGLKKNRLKNKNVFPFLITCYLHNHIEKPGSETYKYYNSGNINEEQIKHANESLKNNACFNSWKSINEVSNKSFVETIKTKKIPKFLMNYDKIKNNYARVKILGNFISALETVTKKTINTKNLPWYPQLVKQELWNETDDNIMELIKSGYKGSLTFRYFEELLNISIHVLEIKDGKYQNLIPEHVEPYIWDYPYNYHVVIFENSKNIYGQTYFWYEILTDKLYNTIFLTDDTLVFSIIYQKYDMSLKPPKNEKNQIQQYIDDQGKCRILLLYDGSKQMTFTRPLILNVMQKPASFYENNINKLNKAKEQMRIQTLDAYKQSNKIVKFFSNNESFEYWLKL